MGHTADQDSDSVMSDFQNGHDTAQEKINIKYEPSKKKHKCSYPECHAMFSRPSRLERHIRSHTGERPYVCGHPRCTKSYTNSSHLKRHLETHNSIKKIYECMQCSRIISNLHNLKRHYKRMHSENKKISCEECGEIFNKRHQLAAHRTIHFGPTIHKCNKCAKTFVNLNKCKRHQQTHESIKSYPCPAAECSEVFNKWLLLQAHKKAKHSDHKCDVCSKIFLKRSQLKSHSKIHSKDRVILYCPYDNCHRIYLFKSNLEQHVESSHLRKKFYCNICSAELTMKQKLIQHIQRHYEPKRERSKKKQLKKRKDVGIPKKSAISKLIGVNLPCNLEKMIIERETNLEVIDNCRNENNLQIDIVKSVS